MSLARQNVALCDSGLRLIIGHFVFAGKYLCLNYFIDSFVLFTAIRKLDVSHCGIGDGHEILANFANLTR